MNLEAYNTNLRKEDSAHMDDFEHSLNMLKIISN